MGAVEVGALVGEQAGDRRAGLIQPVGPAGNGAVVEAVAPVLVLLPARAQPEHQPAAADVVDGGGLLGQYRRVAVGVAGDHGPEPDPGHGRGQPGQQRPALVGGQQFRVDPGWLMAVPLLKGHEMVGHPDPVPAVRLRGPGQGQDAVPVVAARYPESESHNPIV